MPDKKWYEVGPEEGRWPQADPPEGATPIGDPDPSGVTVYLGDDAMNHIAEKIQKQDESTVKGLLLGHPLSQGGRPFIAVTDCIFIDPTSSEKEHTFHFDIDDLDQVGPMWEERPPRTCVVGWFHASPGRERRMTALERFTHERLFSKPWQAALLIDSQNHMSRLYHWQQDQLILAPGYYYFDGEYTPPTMPADFERIETDARETDAMETATKRRTFPVYVLAVLLFGYFLIPGVPGGRTSVNKAVATQSENLTMLRQHLDHLVEEREQLNSMRVESERHTHGTYVDHSPSDGRRADITLVSENTKPKNDAKPKPSGEKASSKSNYVIQPGDTMWRISARLMGDPKAYRGLAESNNIEDPNLIYPGQTIIKPESH